MDMKSGWEGLSVFHTPFSNHTQKFADRKIRMRNAHPACVCKIYINLHSLRIKCDFIGWVLIAAFYDAILDRDMSSTTHIDQLSALWDFSVIDIDFKLYMSLQISSTEIQIYLHHWKNNIMWSCRPNAAGKRDVAESNIFYTMFQANSKMSAAFLVLY